MITLLMALSIIKYAPAALLTYVIIMFVSGMIDR